MFNQIGFNQGPFNRATETEITPSGIAVARAVASAIIFSPGPGPLPTLASGMAVAKAVCFASRLHSTVYKSLDLSEMTILAGAEIVIDTEYMTVTLDGQNAVYILSDESRFFDIAKGDTLEIEGDGQASITVQWKDRWL